MSAITHRFLRLSAFIVGLLVGGLSVLFAFDNPAHISLAVGSWQLQGVPLWTVAVVPLVLGVAAGYLYHLPARMHHFGEHMRHRGLVHDLNRENGELTRRLNNLLAMPNDDSPAIAAAAAARDVTPSPAVIEAIPEPAFLETVSSPAPTVSDALAAEGNGHRPRRTDRRPQQRLVAAPEAMKEAIAAAAAAMPVERHARAARPGRVRKTIAEPLDPGPHP